MKRKIVSFSIILIGLSICLTGVQAASLGEKINFYVDSTYDATNRSQITASLKEVSDYAYFYVDDDYWQKLSSNQRVAFMDSLRDLADEFDRVIYPKERAVFGSEWNPGIDNDSRITVLVTELINQAGGYINTNDAYLKTQVPSSNQREMIYLNAINIFDEQNKAYLAHEFQHLITSYQKTILYGLEEDVWLNEARSEYAPTLCGYNNLYADSYLADRVDIFSEYPSDSLTEWKNNTADYGTASLFIHFLVDHYGQEILTKMMLNNKVGIESINQALSEINSSKDFSDVFADWAVASFLNNCLIEPKNTYCYFDNNLTQQRVNVDYSASYSGFPNLIVSRSSAVKDWSPYWYRFRQISPIDTERDTLKLEFSGSSTRGNFRVPYILIDPNEDYPLVGEINLTNQQGTVYIPNFSSRNKSIIIIPFNQYKQKYFGSNELSSVFTFTASSINTSSLSVTSLSPNKGTINGGFQATVKGTNFSTVSKVVLGSSSVNYNIVDDQTITFNVPSHSAGFADLKISNSNGDEYSLVNALEYTNSSVSNYPEGSLLRAKGDVKVYVIKGNYKRWIQTADIFNHYGHLKWENIIEVEPSELNNYQESWLVRADGDKRVYQIDSSGNKRWLNMTGEQFGLSGRNWATVFVINSYERDAYQTGANISY